jgi:hypothetical protein
LTVVKNNAATNTTMTIVNGMSFPCES